jgi:hypothetical protein
MWPVNLSEWFGMVNATLRRHVNDRGRFLRLGSFIARG